MCKKLPEPGAEAERATLRDERSLLRFRPFTTSLRHFLRSAYSTATFTRGAALVTPIGLLHLIKRHETEVDAQATTEDASRLGERLFAVAASFCRPARRPRTTKFTLVTPPTRRADSHPRSLDYLWIRSREPHRSLPLANARRLAYTARCGELSGTRILALAIATVAGPGRLGR